MQVFIATTRHIFTLKTITREVVHMRQPLYSRFEKLLVFHVEEQQSVFNLLLFPPSYFFHFLSFPPPSLSLLHSPYFLLIHSMQLLMNLTNDSFVFLRTYLGKWCGYAIAIKYIHDIFGMVSSLFSSLLIPPHPSSSLSLPIPKKIQNSINIFNSTTSG